MTVLLDVSLAYDLLSLLLIQYVYFSGENKVWDLEEHGIRDQEFKKLEAGAVRWKKFNEVYRD